MSIPRGKWSSGNRRRTEARPIGAAAALTRAALSDAAPTTAKAATVFKASDLANEVLYVSVVAGAVIMVDLRPRNVINVGEVKLLLICS